MRLSTISKQETGSDQGSEGGFLDLVLILVRHRRIFAAALGLAIFVGLLVALLTPPTYKATERLMPPKAKPSIEAMMLGSMGSLAASAAADSLGIHDPNDLYVGVLRSDSIADALITKFDLQKVYKTKNKIATIKALHAKSDIVAGQDSIISIEVSDHDPRRAAAMANAYSDQLRETMARLSSSEAQQRREYYAQQMAKAKEELANAEAALRQSQERTGLIDLNEQAKAIIGGVASLRAQVAATEVELRGMLAYATPSNPDVERLQQQLAALRSQLAKVEGSSPSGSGNIQVPTGKVPAAGQEYVRRYRDVKYYETLYELVGKQFEAARLEESSTVSSVQVLDRAFPPDYRSSPQRTLIMLISAVVGLFLAIAAVFTREAWERASSDSNQAVKLSMIRSELKGGWLGS